MKKSCPPLLILYFILLTASGPLLRAETEGSPQPVSKAAFQNFDDALDRLGQPVKLHDEQVTLQMDAEFRHRFEFRDDYNFNDASYEDSAINLLRSRLGAKLKWGKRVTAYVQGQDAESFASRKEEKSAGFINQLDLRQLNLELESPWEKAPVRIKAGRQELSYGDQRFVGSFDWSNVARVFDAVKTVYSPVSWFQADAWFSQVVQVDRGRADSAAHDDNFYGIYTALKPVKDHVLDTFLFIRHNRNNDLIGERPGERGQLKEYTTGNRFKGKKWNFDYGIEWAIQFGSRAHDRIESWAFHQDIGYTFEKLPWDPRMSFEYNHGSGDSDPRDGKVETFDNLYPANHVFYGFMDFASLKNMHNLRIGTDAKPHPKIHFSLDYHWFFLDTNGSPWFNAGQAAIRPRTAGASTTAGRELDLLLKWKALKHLGLLMGYSHFQAGPYLRDSGAADDANLFYVMTTVSV